MLYTAQTSQVIGYDVNTNISMPRVTLYYSATMWLQEE